MHRACTPDHESPLAEEVPPGSSLGAGGGPAPDATVPAACPAGPPGLPTAAIHELQITGRMAVGTLTLMPKGLQPARPSAGSVLGLPSEVGSDCWLTGQVCGGLQGTGAPGGGLIMRPLPCFPPQRRLRPHQLSRLTGAGRRVGLPALVLQGGATRPPRSWDLTDLQGLPCCWHSPGLPDPVPLRLRPPPQGGALAGLLAFRAAWARVCGYTQGTGARPSLPGVSAVLGSWTVG